MLTIGRLIATAVAAFVALVPAWLLVTVFVFFAPKSVFSQVILAAIMLTALVRTQVVALRYFGIVFRVIWNDLE